MSRHGWLRRIALLAAASSAACGSESDSEPPSDAPPIAADLELTWEPCNLVTQVCDLDPGGCPNPTNDAECTTVLLPAQYDEPGAGTVELHLKRLRATAPRRGQLWLLMGGPGGTVARFGTAQRYHRHADLDLYLLDHRGVGRSTRLACPTEEAETSPVGFTITLDETPSCISHLLAEHGSLEPFNTTDAAHDLGTLIAATAAPSDEVYVYGVSYGTYWLHRYSQLYPTQPSALIFDSLCSPGACRLQGYDLAHDEIGRSVLALCAADPMCASKLPNPELSLRALLDAVDQGHCAALPTLNREALRVSLGRLLQVRPFHAAIPALIYRLTRCADADVAALTHFTETVSPLFEPAPIMKRLETLETLGRHIVLSELWQTPDAGVLAATDAALFTAGLVRTFHEVSAFWPLYEPPALRTELTTTEVPVLMLQGELDPQTPPSLAEELRAHLSGPHQSYVFFPYVTHNVVFSSQYGRDPGLGMDLTCGSDIIEQFTRDPTSTLDTACATGMLPPDFAGTPEVADWLFGTTDLWE